MGLPRNASLLRRPPRPVLTKLNDSAVFKGAVFDVSAVLDSPESRSPLNAQPSPAAIAAKATSTTTSSCYRGKPFLGTPTARLPVVEILGRSPLAPGVPTLRLRFSVSSLLDTPFPLTPLQSAVPQNSRVVPSEWALAKNCGGGGKRLTRIGMAFLSRTLPRLAGQPRNSPCAECKRQLSAARDEIPR
jgi:hypothetical protein